MEQLGSQVEEIDVFPWAQDAWAWHQTIMDAEMAHNLRREWSDHKDRLSGELRSLLERGQNVKAVDYQLALSRIEPLHASFRELFEQRYDAILTPAAPGAAPRGLDSTGDPVFCTLWTLCGMPAISLPLLQSGDGLPIGVQLVGPRHGDARLLRTAHWLAAKIASTETT
jgi:Asp-tRNA(Asn)/Glu-tRNA(Gln) amidotransferase A subunit family amidase